MRPPIASEDRSLGEIYNCLCADIFIRGCLVYAVPSPMSAPPHSTAQLNTTHGLQKPISILTVSLSPRMYVQVSDLCHRNLLTEPLRGKLAMGKITHDMIVKIDLNMSMLSTGGNTHTRAPRKTAMRAKPLLYGARISC